MNFMTWHRRRGGRVSQHDDRVTTRYSNLLSNFDLRVNEQKGDRAFVDQHFDGKEKGPSEMTSASAVIEASLRNEEQTFPEF